MHIETITLGHLSTRIWGSCTIGMGLVGFCLTISGLDSTA
jgi:hypothetical protein